MPDHTLIVSGISAFLFTLFGWVIRTSSTNASEALGLSKELDRRLDAVEKRVDGMQELTASVRVVEAEIKNLEVTMKRVEDMLLRQYNK